MNILEYISLKPHTSIYAGGEARYFAECKNAEEVVEAAKWAKEKGVKIFVLGGGSNVVFSDQGFDGLVIKPLIMGITIQGEHEDHVTIEAGAGESWDDLVALAVGKGLYGIENLSHIPGSVGASVVQNIGAYGQEVSTVATQVTAIDLTDFQLKHFFKNDIRFDYRSSRFNTQDKGTYLITSIIIELKKHGTVNTSYADVQKHLSLNGIPSPSVKQMREVIIAIRDKKFPFPNTPTHGTAGSFFKAKPISEAQYKQVIMTLKAKGFEKQAEYLSNMKNSFRVDQGCKVPYGILIEALGLKGLHVGGAKILETHAGVINNFSGNATAADIYKLSSEVIQRVKAEFNVDLIVEPELVGNF